MIAGKRNFLLLLIVIALAGFFFQAFATQRGAGLSNDSAAYLWAARNLDKGVGLGWENGLGEFAPMIWWPPLYPSLLAAIGLSGADPMDAARWLNGALFAATLLLAGAALYAYGNRGAWLAVFGALLVLGSPVLIQIYAMAWSEPLALFFGFLAICLLARHLDDSKRPYLLASAAAGLAFLTRYPCAAFIWAAVLGICFLGRARWVRRISDAVLFGAVSCLPVALWLARNVRAGGSSTGRALTIHLMTGKQFTAILFVISRWIVPDLRPGVALSHNPIRIVNMLVVAAGLALACFLAFRRKAAGIPKEQAPGRLRFLPHLLIGFAVCYGALVAASLSFFDAQTEPDNRILSPLYVALLLFALCAIHWLRPALKGRKTLSAAAVCLPVAFGLFYLAGAWRWAGEAARQGEGFQSRAWHGSEMIGEIKKLPPETTIYTNNTWAVYIMADKVSREIPRKHDPITLKPNARYCAEFTEMSERLEKHDAGLAYFKGQQSASFFPSDDELKAALPGALVSQGPDGRIYRGAK